MKISPATEQRKPNYPALLAAAVVVTTAALVSCQQQQQQQNQALGGVWIHSK